MTDTYGISGDKLKSFIERIERMNENKQAISDDIKEIYSEAKAIGFDVKILREVIKLRKKDRDQRQEEKSLLDLYMSAIGETI